MKMFFDIIARMIESIAHFGAGTVSVGMGYEPELPDELVK